MDIDNNIKNLINKFICQNKNKLNNQTENITITKEVNIDKNINFNINFNVNEQINTSLEKIGLKADAKTLQILKYLIDHNITIDEDNLYKFNKLLKLLNENIEDNILDENIEDNILDENIEDNILDENINKENNIFNKDKVIENNTYNKNNILEKNINKEIDIYKTIFNNKDNNNNNIFNKDIIKKALFILENDIPITKNNINILDNMLLNKDYFENNLYNLSEEIENINNIELKKDIIKILLENNLYENKKENNINFSDIKKVEINNSIKNNKNIKNIINNKDIIIYNLKENKLTKDIINNILKNETKLENSDYLLISNILFKDNTKIKNLFLKQLNVKQNQNIFNKFNIDFKDKNLNINRKLNELNNALRSLKKLIEKVDPSNKSFISSLSKTYNSLQFLNFIKISTFIPIPITIDNNKLDAKLFIFKNKKNKKNKDNISALISLNTVNLGKIETYIQKNNINLNLQFRLENDNIKNILKNNIEILNNLLKSHGYNISNYSFLHIDKDFDILSKKPKININNFKNYEIDTEV